MNVNDLFGLEFHLRNLDKGTDPLVRLDELVEWELFRPTLRTIRDKDRKSNAGRKPFDEVMMFKILVLQSLYNLSDDATEFQIRDRFSFLRFLGFNIGETVPDSRTIRLFREQLTEEQLVETLFNNFNEYLDECGLMARKGQIVDASIVEAPRQRNTREENDRIKAGETPKQWEGKPEKLRQKDVDARWVQKNDVNYYGYKNHICIDVKHKLIRAWAVTDASRHDSQVVEELIANENTSADVWADSAYRAAEIFELLVKWGLREHVQRKGYRDHPLTAWEKQGNRTRAKVRARVEHVFGAQVMRAKTLVVRTIGISRARAKIGLRNLTYNIERFGMLMAARG
jgi:IS5 family transposase